MPFRRSPRPWSGNPRTPLQRSSARRATRSAGLRIRLDQISLRTGAAGLTPFEADLARIRREAARTTDQLEAMVEALGKLRLGATPEAQQTIDALVGRVQDVQAGQGEALADALLERQERAGQRLIEQAEDRLAQMREPPGTQGFPFGPPARGGAAAAGDSAAEARGEIPRSCVRPSG